jgi:hypothetical protein
MKYVVMFSGGIGSWAAARRIVDAHGAENVTLLFSDVKGTSNDDNPHIGEDEDTYRFLDEAVADLGAEFVRLVDGRDIWQVFKDQRYLGNSRMAKCSQDLKQRPAKRWLRANTTPETHTIVIGVDWMETQRIPAIEKAYAPYTVLFPMCDAPYLDKQDMIDLAAERGILPPRLYAMGFSHNNCGGGCVKAGQGQFKMLLELMPERYAVWEAKEQEIRDYLGRDDITILREQKDGVRRSLPLTVLRQRQTCDVDLDDVGGCGCFVDDFSMAGDDEDDAS